VGPKEESRFGFWKWFLMNAGKDQVYTIQMNLYNTTPDHYVCARYTVTHVLVYGYPVDRLILRKHLLTRCPYHAYLPSIVIRMI
jgi:hypothetical protein